MRVHVQVQVPRMMKRMMMRRLDQHYDEDDHY
jgi:hypothetical protein